MKDLIAGLFILLCWLGIIFATVGAWVQHVITCIHNESIILLTAGVVLPPIGVIHGWLIWAGIAG